MRLSDPELVDRLAASYVLGTLVAGARRRFERLLRDRADVRLAVTQWESRLGTLARSVPARQPAPRVWQAIEMRTRQAATYPARVGWRTAGWGAGGLVAGFALALSAVFVSPALFLTADRVAMRSGEKLPQSYVGLLTDAQGEGKLLVSSLRHGRTMTVKVLGPIPAPAEGRLVLWALPADAPPFMLGAVPTSGSAIAPLNDTSEKLLSKVRKLVVTVETVASPAAPGPALYQGNCAKLW